MKIQYIINALENLFKEMLQDDFVSAEYISNYDYYRVQFMLEVMYFRTLDNPCNCTVKLYSVDLKNKYYIEMTYDEIMRRQ